MALRALILAALLAGCALPPCEQVGFEVPGSEAWERARLACLIERGEVR